MNYRISTPRRARKIWNEIAGSKRSSPARLEYSMSGDAISKRGFNSAYERHSKLIPALETVVLLAALDAEGVKTANALCIWHPCAQIHWLRPTMKVPEALADVDPRVQVSEISRPPEVHNKLQKLCRIDVIVEVGTKYGSVSFPGFDETIFYIGKGGMYLSLDLATSFLERGAKPDDEHSLSNVLGQVLKGKSRAASSSLDNSLKELALAIDHVAWYANAAFILKAIEHHYKLREHEATPTLAARYGDNWGESTLVHPKGKFRSLASVSTNRSDLADRFPAEISFPALSRRVYKNASIRPGQVASVDNLLLPDSFRRLLAKHLENRNIVFSSSRFGRMHEFAPGEAESTLAGYFFYLDTEHPGVYGHIPTEIVSRLWAWPQAKLEFPDMRALVCPKPGEADIPGYERQILNAYGIPDNDIQVVHGPARVEYLVAATPMFSNPKYVVPELRQVWTEIRENLRDRSFEINDRVFLTRAENSVRHCRNNSEVEALFSSYGFDVLRPEFLTLGQQVELFSTCKVIAGYGGSAMLNGIFSDRPSTRILISPDTYITANEYLISSIVGDNFNYFWCKADVQNPVGRRTQAAFESAFAFDFEADGDSLKTLLQAL